MLEWIIPIITEFIPVWDTYLVHVFALALLATLPILIRKVVQWR